MSGKRRCTYDLRDVSHTDFIKHYRVKMLIINIDVSFIQTIIERGLVARHRRLKFTARLADRPGSLVQLLNHIAASRANVLAVEHDKLRTGLDPNETTVRVVCEVGGEEHGEAVVQTLRDNGYLLEVEEV